MKATEAFLDTISSDFVRVKCINGKDVMSKKFESDTGLAFLELQKFLYGYKKVLYLDMYAIAKENGIVSSFKEGRFKRKKTINKNT